jgi:hypothetical protein
MNLLFTRLRLNIQQVRKQLDIEQFDVPEEFVEVEKEVFN